MEKYGVKFSQLDAAFPVSVPEGASLGLIYILNSIRWAKLVGCSHIDTTDHMFKPEGMTDEEALEMMKRIYSEVVETAERYEMIINILLDFSIDLIINILPPGELLHDTTSHPEMYKLLKKGEVQQARIKMRSHLQDVIPLMQAAEAKTKKDIQKK